MCRFRSRLGLEIEINILGLGWGKRGDGRAGSGRAAVGSGSLRWRSCSHACPLVGTIGDWEWDWGGEWEWEVGSGERERRLWGLGALDDGCGVWLMREGARRMPAPSRDAFYFGALACALRLGLHEPNPASVVLFAAAS